MSTGAAGMEGSQPIQQIGTGNPEAIKYGRMWEKDAYRAIAPGEVLAQHFMDVAKPRRGAECIDFGCGTGRGALMLAILGGLKVTMLDFVRNSLDPEIKDALTTQSEMLKFIKHDLEQPIPIKAEYGYCTDVMEHIPPDKVDLVLDNILKSANHVFFSIATFDDICGRSEGLQLHLTVKPYEWWLEKFKERECLIAYSEPEQNYDYGSCFFYVSAWPTAQDFMAHGCLNMEEQELLNNVKTNIARGFHQVSPHVTNDQDVMILGGGPSLAQFEDEMKRLKAEGVKVVTLNGAYHWALEHGLGPVNQFVMDGRPFNARFTKPVVDGCKYFIASQCHPSCFDEMPMDRTYIWHTNSNNIKGFLKEQYGDNYAPIPGGTTILLRAIPCLRTMGFRRFHLFGCDSCVIQQQHHAYAQPENDALDLPVLCGGRFFQCQSWMISQGQELMEMIKVMGDEMELEIYGDGLLAHILKTGADRFEEVALEHNF